MTEITEPTLKLCLNEPSIRRVAEVLRAARLDLIAEQIEAQIQPPVPAEPTGDVVLFVFGVDYKRQDDGEWWPVETPGAGYEWSDLIEDCDRTNSARPVVYRREPSPEAVEALAHELSVHTFAVDRPGRESLFRQFAARLANPNLTSTMFGSNGGELDATEGSVEVEKVRQVLRTSPPAHHLLDTSTWTAYTDLRKRIAALLPEGAQ